MAAICLARSPSPPAHQGTICCYRWYSADRNRVLYLPVAPITPTIFVGACDSLCRSREAERNYGQTDQLLSRVVELVLYRWSLRLGSTASAFRRPMVVAVFPQFVR